MHCAQCTLQVHIALQTAVADGRLNHREREGLHNAHVYTKMGGGTELADAMVEETRSALQKTAAMAADIITKGYRQPCVRRIGTEAIVYS